MINEFDDEFDQLKKMYRGWAGDGFHPNSPNGGGGPGFFQPALQWGRTAAHIDGLPDPFSPAGLRQTAEQIKEKFTLPDPIKLTDIPAVMRKKNWPMGAAVMEKWFAQDARQMTQQEKEGTVKPDQYPSNLVDTTLLTMTWLKKFTIVKEGLANLVNNLNSPRARNQIRTLFINQLNHQLIKTPAYLSNLEITGAKTTTPPTSKNKQQNPQLASFINKITFNSLNNIAKEQRTEFEIHFQKIETLLQRTTVHDFLRRDKVKNIGHQLTFRTIKGTLSNKRNAIYLHSYWQFQYQPIKSTIIQNAIYGLDDLDAALHSFGLYAAILEATITDSGVGQPFIVNVKKIGIYMKDTFDFLDENTANSQYLGHWNLNGVTYNKPLAHTWYLNLAREIVWPIHNADFRNYQTNNKKGGDLILFTDIEEIEVNIAIEI